MVKKITKGSGISPKKAKHISRDTAMPTTLPRLLVATSSVTFPGGVPFSEFDVRGNVRVTDIIVGLRNDENSQFLLGAGLLDADDNFIIGYSSVGADAVNYLKFINAATGDAPTIIPVGQDGNIGITIQSKNNAPINLRTQNNYLNFNDTDPFYGFTTDDTFTDASDEYAPSALATKNYVDAAVGPLSDLTFITNTDETADLPNSHQLLGTENQITATNGTLSLPTTLIAPGTFQAATSINIGGTGATITNFSTDGTLTGNSDELSSTQKAVKTYVDTSDTAVKSYSYITKTDNTANLPGSTPLSGLASGFLSNTTATGVLNPRTHTGTANEIDITNGDGVSGNPTYHLSSTMIAPGTFQATTSINIGGSGATITSFSTDGTLSANSDALLTTQKAIKTYVDATVVPFQFGMADLVATSNITLSGIQTVDGIATTTQVILAQNQTSAADNGLWTANIAGAWTRTSGYTIWSNFYRLVISITGGLTQKGTSWECTVGNAGTVGTDSLPFVSAAFQTYYAGSGLTLSDNIFSLTAPVSLANGGTNSTSAQTAMNTLAGGVTSAQYLRGNGSNVVLSAIQAADVPTLNQNTTGQSGSVANAATFNNGGSGDASGVTYNGSATKTISYNTIGASPLAGSSSIVTVGTIGAGTWQGTTIELGYGGTGFSTYAKGDLIHASATDTLSKLGIGNTGDVITVVSGDAAWVAPSVRVSNISMIPTTAGVSFTWSSSSTAYEMTSLGTNFTLSTSSALFDMPTDGRLRYVGTQTITASVRAYMKLNASGTYTMYIYKNGSLADQNTVAPGGATSFSIQSVPVTLATNDYLSVFIQRTTVPFTGAINNVSLSVEF